MNKLGKDTCPHRLYIWWGEGGWLQTNNQLNQYLSSDNETFYGENKTDKWMRGWEQRWSLEGANTWVRNFGGKHSRQREQWVLSPWVGIDFQVPRNKAKKLSRATVQFPLGSVGFALDPRYKPICMAGLNNPVNSDPCAWALRMSSTHLGFVYSFFSCWMSSVLEISEQTLQRKHRSFKWESKQTGDAVIRALMSMMDFEHLPRILFAFSCNLCWSDWFMLEIMISCYNLSWVCCWDTGVLQWQW